LRGQVTRSLSVLELFANMTYFHCVVLGCANLFTSMIL
jgi:hypothetical protein